MKSPLNASSFLLRALSAFAFCALSLSHTDVASAQSLTLRPVDRATVRVISMHGIDVQEGAGRRTQVMRFGPNTSTSYCSGVVVDARIILTARHCVEGTDLIGIVPPGEGETALPARVIYSDLLADFAFIALTDGRLSHTVRLPRREIQLSVSQSLVASGYPVDGTQHYPAATSGVVSRMTREGQLQVSMGVNPGNSGGPVVDDAGQLVGIVSSRGRPEAGVQNIAMLVPMNEIRRVFAERVSRMDLPSAASGETAQDLSAALHRLSRMQAREADELAREGEPERAERLASQDLRPEARALSSAYAWDILISILEMERVAQIEGIQDENLRRRAVRLRELALVQAQQAQEAGVYVLRHYPFLRRLALSGGAVEVQRASEDAEAPAAPSDQQPSAGAPKDSSTVSAR